LALQTDEETGKKRPNRVKEKLRAGQIVTLVGRHTNIADTIDPYYQPCNEQ